MEKELLKSYEAAKLAAGSEDGDPSEEIRCPDAFKEPDDCPISDKIVAKNQNGENGKVRPQYDHEPCSQKSNHLISSERVDDNVVLGSYSKVVEVEKWKQLDQSPSLSAEASTSPIKANSPGTTTKGYGLKKWRRLRREIPKDATTNLDSIKMLKRGSNVVDGKQPSDVTVSSTKAIDQRLGVANSLGHPSSSTVYSLPVNTPFSAGADSDNSEDKSNKSSTAASAPRYRHDALRALGHQRDKQRVKILGGRNPGSGGPRSQTGKSLAMADPSKKARGERVKVEEENSLSSIESDSRSNFVFIRGTPVIGEEKRINHDVEDADDEPTSKEKFEDLSADCSKNISMSQDSLDANEIQSKNELSTDSDPLVNSVLMLQSAQAALEKEVQQFAEIGKGIHSFCKIFEENGANLAHSMSLGPEVTLVHTSNGWVAESNHLSSDNDGQILEKLKEKESRIVELEAKIISMKSPLKDMICTVQMEPELESLFKKKVEAEVEFFVMTRSAKELSGTVKSHLKLLKEQKSLVMELAQSPRPMADIGNKNMMPQDYAKEVRSESEEIAKMERRVVKFTKYFFLQLILQLLVLGFFFLQLSPKSAVVVPT